MIGLLGGTFNPPHNGHVALAHLVGGDRNRVELEEAHAVRAIEPLEHAVEPLARIARAGADGDRHALEDAVRIRPVEEVAELVGAEQKDWVVEAAVAEHVDGALVRVELDAAAREGGAREAKPALGVEPDPLVARALRDEDDEVLEAELLLGGAGERDVAVVRRVEGASEEPGHSYSTTSPPKIPRASSARSTASWPSTEPASRSGHRSSS